MSQYRTALVPGDNFGLEAPAAARKGLRLSFATVPRGTQGAQHNRQRYLGTGTVMPEDGLARLATFDASYLLVGGGGIRLGVNAALALRLELDRLPFDWHGPSQEALERYRAAGSTKPLMNMAVVGGWGQGFVEEDDVPAPAFHSPWPGWGRDIPQAAPPRCWRVQGMLSQQTEDTHRGRAEFLAEVAYAAHAGVLALRPTPGMVARPATAADVRLPVRPGWRRRPRQSRGSLLL